MRFLLNEYISLLKEDGELDTLITDLLICMNVIPISKPQKGRQFGVDIAAVGIDPEDGLKKVFLIAVKQGNLTRTSWDTGVNAVRPTFNEILDTYTTISLTTKYQKLPKKIILCTNGHITQPVQPNYTQFVNENSKEDVEFSFWGINEIAKMVDEYLLTEKLFPSSLQSLLRKTLAFLDLADYDLRHFYQLIEEIFTEQEKQKQRILKRMRLMRLCLGILFKWSQDIDNLKPSFLAAERCALLCWNWVQKGNHLDKKYVGREFYQLYFLKREIGVALFNKLSEHYRTQHSIHRYSKNEMEYSLTIWEHMGIIATIGLAEWSEISFNYDENKPEVAEFYFNNAIYITETLNDLIRYNPPSIYPQYDEHSIEIALALNLFLKTNRIEMAKDWLKRLVMGMQDALTLTKFFPLFRKSFDKLVDINFGLDQSKNQSSMILPILIEFSVVLGDDEVYEIIKNFVKEYLPEINHQLWLPTDDTEEYVTLGEYSRSSGSVKHSIKIYDKMNDYRNEMQEELKLFASEKEFKINTLGFDILGHIASRHYRAQPFPHYWRKYLE